VNLGFDAAGQTGTGAPIRFLLGERYLPGLAALSASRQNRIAQRDYGWLLKPVETTVSLDKTAPALASVHSPPDDLISTRPLTFPNRRERLVRTAGYCNEHTIAMTAMVVFSYLLFHLERDDERSG
jgi:hypothetical protein